MHCAMGVREVAKVPQTERPRQPVHLRRRAVVLQVFVGSGEALATRVYRRQPPEPNGVMAGVHLVAHGGPLQVVSGEAYLMGSIWE